MPDDLHLLAPTDPARTVPDWPEARRRMLDQIVTAPPARRRSWLPLAAAAALVAVLAGVLVVVNRPVGPTVAAPSPSASRTDPRWVTATTTVTASGMLIETPGAGVEICLRAVAESLPPQCGGPKVSGLSWDQVPWRRTITRTSETGAELRTVWAEAAVVGTYDEKTFRVTAVYRSDDPARPERSVFTQLADNLCSPAGYTPGPVMTRLPTSDATLKDLDAKYKVAQRLPGLVTLWHSPDHRVLNVIVDSDREGAERALSGPWSGVTCVAQRPRPTEAELRLVEEALRRAQIYVLRSPSSPDPNLIAWVDAFTPTSEAAVRAAVPADMLPYVSVVPWIAAVE